MELLVLPQRRNIALGRIQPRRFVGYVRYYRSWGYRPTVPVIYCDNVGATYLCANPVFHSRMKHIAIDYHFIRNMIQLGMIRVSHISTKDQLADALTKPLSRQQFTLATSKIGVTQVPPS